MTLLITGTALNDTLQGVDEMNQPYTLEGRGGDDVLMGGGGDDTLVGGLGNDLLLGGAGSDTYVYLAGHGRDQVLDTSGGTNTLAFGSGITLAGLSFTRHGSDLVIAVTSPTPGRPDGEIRIVEALAPTDNDSVTTLTFEDGTRMSLAEVLAGRVVPNVIAGTFGDDLLLGTGGVDWVKGLAGNDVLDGRAGADVMTGGEGDDVYWVDDAGDTVWETATGGVDLVRSGLDHTLGDHVENLLLFGGATINGTGNNLNNRLTGNVASNTLHGAAGDDLLTGGGGDDTLVGGDGVDQLLGGLGNDVLHADRADFLLNNGRGGVNGGAGVDWLIMADDDIATSGLGVILSGYNHLMIEGVRATQGSDYVSLYDASAATALTLLGEAGDDLLEAGYGNDRLEGGDGDDFLIAGRGNDVLHGGAGDDILRGGGDLDVCYGGLGNDTYLFRRNTIVDTAVEEGGELDSVHLGPDFAGGRMAFFRDGDDLLISYNDRRANYLGTYDVFRVQNQFLGGDHAVEAFGNEVGLRALSTLATNVGAPLALASFNGPIRGGTGVVFTAGEIDTITAHIAAQGVTSIAEVLESDTLLRYIAAFG